MKRVITLILSAAAFDGVGEWQRRTVAARVVRARAAVRVVRALPQRFPVGRPVDDACGMCIINAGVQILIRTSRFVLQVARRL